jgi:hypothetical protein
MDMHDAMSKTCIQDEACKDEMQAARQVIKSAITVVDNELNAASARHKACLEALTELTVSNQRLDDQHNKLENLVLKAAKQQILALHCQSFSSPERKASAD